MKTFDKRTRRFIPKIYIFSIFSLSLSALPVYPSHRKGRMLDEDRVLGHPYTCPDIFVVDHTDCADGQKKLSEITVCWSDRSC